MFSPVMKKVSKGDLILISIFFIIGIILISLFVRNLILSDINESYKIDPGQSLTLQSNHNTMTGSFESDQPIDVYWDPGGFTSGDGKLMTDNMIEICNNSKSGDISINSKSSPIYLTFVNEGQKSANVDINLDTKFSDDRDIYICFIPGLIFILLGIVFLIWVRNKAKKEIKLLENSNSYNNKQ